MTGYAEMLTEMEEFGEGRFGDNPDPAQERYERFLTEQMHLRKIKSEAENPSKLETSVKFELPSEGKKRKRTLLDVPYEDFYKEAIKLSRDISLQSEDKRRLLIKYYPKFRDKGAFPIRNIDPLKIGCLFNRFFAYSEKRTNQ